MKARAVVLLFALCFVGMAAAYAADDAFMGTWKLNEAKSKFGPGATKNTTVIYEAAGDNVKITVEGTDKDGKATRNEWTGKFDGKDYPVAGDPTSDARAYKKMNDHALTFAATKDGKVTLSGRIVVAPDGQSRTVRTHGIDATGKMVVTTAVYDKK